MRVIEAEPFAQSHKARAQQTWEPQGSQPLNLHHSEEQSLKEAQCNSNAYPALTSVWGEGAGHSPQVLLDLRPLERSWRNTFCPVQLLPCLGWPLCPSAYYRALGCSSLPVASADTPGCPPAWRGASTVDAEPGSPGSQSMRPKFMRSAETTEPWQGTLFQIRGYGGWGGWAGLQRFPEFGSTPLCGLCPLIIFSPEDVAGWGKELSGDLGTNPQGQSQLTQPLSMWATPLSDMYSHMLPPSLSLMPSQNQRVSWTHCPQVGAQ